MPGKETDLGETNAESTPLNQPSNALPAPITDVRLVEVVKVLTYLGGKPTSKRLNKLAYLAELESLRTRGVRLTRTPFVRYKHGPFSSDVALAAEIVPEDISVTEFQTQYGNRGKRYVPRRIAANVNLSADELQVLRNVLRWAKGKDTETITQQLDNSAPFVWTLRTGDRIDFDRFARLLDVAKAGRQGFDRGKGKVLLTPQDVREYLAAI